MPRHSGLQLEVLKLYKSALQMARAKAPEYRGNWERAVRTEFDQYRTLDHKDFATIEYLVRQGRKRVDTFRNPAVQNIQWPVPSSSPGPR
ncbi:hypothetical protein BC828DRAFT_373922 [Blastocladiella britannica]|nr:hypothetical protein BC828DRAFT_373922 [Blastocladiella britannica]